VSDARRDDLASARDSSGRYVRGTFQLTDEPPLEPPQRARAAWAAAGLPASRL
jgi:hypothetical protein